MITLIWKELRENLKWALLAMALLGAAEICGLYQIRDGQSDYYSYYEGITLCKASFLTITSFACPAIGFLLGLIQVLPELKRDRWAALLHRPVPREVIFFGKAVAGLILYAVATVPPFLLSVWLVSSPGHFAAPFVPGLALAGTADTCAGLIYYFAAFMVALQRGGWVGLRGLPLLAAIHASFFVMKSSHFAAAVWAAVFMAVALCLAAWGAIRHQESFGSRPWPGKFAFLAVAFYGLCGLGDLTQFLYNALAPEKSPFIDYELSDKGAPLKLTYVDGAIVSVQDLDGRTPEDQNYKLDRIRQHLRYLNTSSSYIGDSHGLRPSLRSYYEYRQSNTYIWSGQPFTYPRLEQWYYLVEERSAVGVLPNKRLPVGRLDAHGFEPISAHPVPFPTGTELLSQGGAGYCLWDAKSVRFVNLARREIVNVPLPVPGPIYGVTVASANDEGIWTAATVVSLSTATALYDQKDGRLIATLPYHRDVDRWGRLAAGMNATKDRFYLWYKPSAWISRKIQNTMPSYLEEVNAQGQTLRSFTIPPIPVLPNPRTWDDFVARRLQSPAFFFGTMLYQKLGSELGNVRLKEALSRRLGEEWRLTKEIAVCITLLSALSAAATLWWARRVHFSRRRAWAWAGLAFALNLAGLIIFRLTADWPRLVPCSACGRGRPIDREACPHCGHGWPESKPNGTEIFDHGADEAPEAASAV